MGSIYTTGSRGFLGIRYYNRAGIQVDESARTKDRDIAKALLRQREADVSKGKAIPRKAGRLTLEDGFRLVVADYEAKQNDSIVLLEARYRLHLVPFFGAKRRLVTIDGLQIAAFRQHRTAQGAKAATINRELAILRRAFRLAIQADLLAGMPYISTPAEKNARTGFFDRAAFEAIQVRTRPETRDALEVGYWTGWRMNAEILTLEVDQYDRATKVLTLRPDQAKNDRGRVFPCALVPQLAAALDRTVAEHDRLVKAGQARAYELPAYVTKDGRQVPARVYPAATLFLRRSSGHGAEAGEPLRSIRGDFDQAREAASQAGALVHALRRTAVRNLERAGVARSQGMALVGHETDSMYTRYAIVNEADLAAAVAKLAASSAPPPAAPAGAVVSLEDLAAAVAQLLGTAPSAEAKVPAEAGQYRTSTRGSSRGTRGSSPKSRSALKLVKRA